MLNNITIMGRLVHSPDLRYTQSQTAVCSFSIACERDRKENGEKVTDFFDCTAWRNTAEFICNHISKGTLVIISGRLAIREWKDRDGNKRRNAEVNVENIYFAESKRKTDTDERPPMPSDADAPPEVDHEGLARLANEYPGNVQYADSKSPLPWE